MSSMFKKFKFTAPTAPAVQSSPESSPLALARKKRAQQQLPPFQNQQQQEQRFLDLFHDFLQLATSWDAQCDDMYVDFSYSPCKKWLLITYALGNMPGSMADHPPTIEAVQLYNMDVRHILKWHKLHLTVEMKTWLERKSTSTPLDLCVEETSLSSSMWRCARPFDRKRHTNPFIPDFACNMDNVCSCCRIEVEWLPATTTPHNGGPTLIVSNKFFRHEIHVDLYKTTNDWLLSSHPSLCANLVAMVCDYAFVTLESFLNLERNKLTCERCEDGKECEENDSDDNKDEEEE